MASLVTPQKYLIAQKKHFSIYHGILDDTSKTINSPKIILMKGSSPEDLSVTPVCIKPVCIKNQSHIVPSTTNAWQTKKEHCYKIYCNLVLQ
jgi:hypothetical protein